ncbi:MAG: transposase [Candidatus Methylomirabilales bacterium]
MPRGPRPVVPSIPHHVIHRGNNRQTIFFQGKDYERFLMILTKAKHLHPCRLYAYVLMPNHVHLLLEPVTRDGLGKFMKVLAGRYTRYINREYRRTGTLWEGRFKSSPIQADAYLLACCRYIELNPVRPSLVEAPEDYPWSSYRVRAFGDESRLVDLDPLYEGLGSTALRRQQRYREWMMRTGLETEQQTFRQGVQRGTVVGSDTFGAKVAGIIGQPVTRRNRGRPRKDARK